MKTEMTELLKQLHDLLKKHDATIVRSADDDHCLVLCINNDNSDQSEEFLEDIDSTSIANGWHETIQPINNAMEK